MKPIITIFLFLFTLFSFAQNSFFTTINTPDDQYVEDIFMHNTDYYLVGCRTINDISIGFVYRINENGDVLDSLFLFQENKNITATKGYVLTNNNIRIFGTKEKSNLSGFYDIFLVDVDYQLNVINELCYDRNIGKYWNHINVAINQNNDLVLASSVDGNPPQTGLQYIDKMLIVFSQEGDLIFDSIYNQSSFEMTMDFIKYPNSSNYLLYCIKSFEEGNTLNQINILDSSLNLIQNYYIEDYSSQASICSMNDEGFIVCNKGTPENTNTWHTSVSIYDTLFNKQNQIFYGSEDSASYPAFKNSISFSEENIFIGSTFNIQESSFPIHNSYIRIESMNYELGLNFQKFYGGDAYYLLIDTEPVIDGGVILTGVKYSNGVSGPYERDIFILKVDENGLVTSISEEQNFNVKNAIITPNPGKDYLQLHTGVSNAKLQLHNINGHLAMEKKVNKNTTTINTRSLKSGTYIWSLMKEGQIIENGKWIKE